MAMGQHVTQDDRTEDYNEPGVAMADLRRRLAQATENLDHRTADVITAQEQVGSANVRLESARVSLSQTEDHIEELLDRIYALRLQIRGEPPAAESGWTAPPSPSPEVAARMERIVESVANYGKNVELPTQLAFDVDAMKTWLADYNRWIETH